MHVKVNPGGVRGIRRGVSSFSQRTFETPMDRLPLFVATLLSGQPAIHAASLFVDQVVFTPEHLERLLAVHQLPIEYTGDRSVDASSAEESAALLTAALSDSVDFYFVPQPKRFIVYADHDEYATVFAPRKGTLSLIASLLAEAGFQEVQDYVRRR
jgi:hypothetical protein